MLQGHLLHMLQWHPSQRQVQGDLLYRQCGKALNCKGSQRQGVLQVGGKLWQGKKRAAAAAAWTTQALLRLAGSGQQGAATPLHLPQSCLKTGNSLLSPAAFTNYLYDKPRGRHHTSGYHLSHSSYHD